MSYQILSSDHVPEVKRMVTMNNDCPDFSPKLIYRIKQFIRGEKWIMNFQIG